MIEIAGSSTPNPASNLCPGRDNAAGDSSHTAMTFANVMEKGRPDQVSALGLGDLDPEGRLPAMSLIGPALCKEGSCLTRPQPILDCGALIAVQGRRGEVVDQPGSEVTPGAGGHRTRGQDRFDLQSMQYTDSGRASIRAAAISLPQLIQVPYPPCSIRFNAASTPSS